MRIEVTLALLLGVFLAPYLPISIWAGIAGMAILILLSYFLYQKDIRIWSVLLLSIFLFGNSYYKIRIGFSHEEGNKPEVSEYVRHTEECLTRTHLSETHQRILSAMLLGDRKGLSYEQKAAFKNAGAQHLLALSGLHLGILTTLLYSLILHRVRFTRWRWPVLVVTLFLLWWYAFMVGLPKSLLRATLMYTLFIVGLFANRHTRGYEVLSSAVFLMLLFDPQCTQDIGAQLSVMALVGLTTFSAPLMGITLMPDHAGEYAPPRYPWLQKLWCFACISFSAWLFTMPLILFYFKQLQIWQPLVSIVLVPYTSLLLHLGVLVVLLALAGFEFLLTPLSSLQDLLMDGFDRMLAFSASLPYSTVFLHDITFLHVILLYVLFVILGIALKYHSARIWLLSAISCLVLLGIMAMTTGA